MRTSKIKRAQALELLRSYNKEAFHIQHALTVEGVMRSCEADIQKEMSDMGY